MLKEIRLNGQSGAVGCQSRGAGVRQMYSTKLVGCNSGCMTVAMYQGDSAEEVSSHKNSWRCFVDDHCRNGDSMSQSMSLSGDWPSLSLYFSC